MWADTHGGESPSGGSVVARPVALHERGDNQYAHNRAQSRHEHVLLRIPHIALHADEFLAALRSEDGGHEGLQHFVDGADGKHAFNRQIIQPFPGDAISRIG
jgi:hypothetical protein